MVKMDFRSIERKISHILYMLGTVNNHVHARGWCPSVIYLWLGHIAYNCDNVKKCSGKDILVLIHVIDLFE